jgi:4-amino-4-deoxy-L-arabinose transferase-like glycosyltransferase
VSFGSRLLTRTDNIVRALTDPQRRERVVVGVLAAYCAVWTLYGVLAKSSQDVNYDMAELVGWSREPALGYVKHPPLAAWVVRAWFTLFPVEDWAYYLLAMTSATLALWLAWRLFAGFLDAEKRVVALALLTFVPFYNFHALKFNLNAALVPLWAAASLAFIRSFDTRNIAWAALAGVAASAAMLCKYWSIVLLTGLAVAALIDPRRSVYFRSGAPLVTVFVGALLLAPHIVWLSAHNFAPFTYAITAHETNSFAMTAKDVARYLAGTAGYVVVPVAIALVAMRPSSAALADMLKPSEPRRRFLAAAFWVPLLVPVLPALLIGVEVNSIWSMASWTLLPVVLLSSQRVSISRSAVVAIVTLAVLLPLLMTAAAPGIAMVIHRVGVTPAAGHGRLLAMRMLQEWRQTTDKPLLLVGGQLDLAYVTAFYLPDRPSAFPINLTSLQLAPWVDANRIARQGIVFVCQSRKSKQVCLDRPVTDAIEAIVASSPPARRTVVKIARNYLGFAGQPSDYLVVIVPPHSL